MAVRLIKKKEILEERGLRDLTLSKRKRLWILPDWNDLFSRQRKSKVWSLCNKTYQCSVRIQRRSSRYILKHKTDASWPELVNYWKHVTVWKSRYRDNHLIRPHIHFATRVNFYDWDAVSFQRNTIRYIWLCKLYSNVDTESLNEVLITTC